MDHSPDPPALEPRAFAQRIAGAPISWGACEVPALAAVQDTEWSAPQPLANDGWQHLETRAALFVPWGRRAAPVAQTLQALDEHGYDGWLVLEQDTAITADEPAVTRAPMLAARQSIAFLNSAHTTEEINR